MVVLARGPILAATGAEIISAIFDGRRFAIQIVFQ
jgi:hypothetical protein